MSCLSIWIIFILVGFMLGSAFLWMLKHLNNSCVHLWSKWEIKNFSYNSFSGSFQFSRQARACIKCGLQDFKDIE